MGTNCNHQWMTHLQCVQTWGVEGCYMHNIGGK